MRKTKLHKLPGETREVAQSRVYQDRTKAIVSFIIEFSNKNGYAPSIRDIMPVVGIYSSSTMHKILSRMQEQELILVSQGVARSMKVLPLGMELVS